MHAEKADCKSSQRMCIFQVWNPKYNPDTVLNHAEVLVDSWTRSGRVRGDEAYVWWGKIGVGERPGHIIELVDELCNAARQRRCFLFLTDFRTVHACPVDEIRCRPSASGMLPCPAPSSNVPGYYGKQGFEVLYWYRLRDMILLEDDLLPTMECLGDLVDGNGKALDLYACRGYEYPIPVTVREDSDLAHRLDGHSQGRSDKLSAAKSLALPSRMYRILTELREGMAPGFASLPKDVQVFLADGKLNYDIPRDDYSSAILQVSKAYEVMLRKVLLPKLRDWWPTTVFPSPDIRIPDGTLLSFGDWSPQSRRPLPLAALVDNVLCDRAICAKLPDGRWLGETFAPRLKSMLRRYRNPAAHTERLPKEAAREWHDVTFGSSDVSWILKLNRIACEIAQNGMS